MRKLSILLVAVLVVAMLPSLHTSKTVAQEGKTFTFGSEANPVQLDSAVVTDGASFRVIEQGCEGLLFYDGATTNPIPALAKSWTVSDDGLTWKFELVDNAKFQDGTPFNAEAVKFNFDRWRLTTDPNHFKEQTFEYYGSMFGGFDGDSLITDVQATGDYEVTFTLKSVLAPMLKNLAMPMFAIHSPAAIKANGAKYGTPDVGYSCTGPYKFVEWVSDDHVKLVRNPDYWGTVPGNVDTIIFRIIPDPAARLAALQSGEIDAFEGPNPEDLATIENSSDLYLMARPPMNVMYLAFSYRIKEFRDPKVRQAIAMAINRDEIVKAFYPPGSVVAVTMIPPVIWGDYKPNVQPFAFDPEGAKKLLADAGYPNGFKEVTVLKVDANGKVTDEVEKTMPLTLYYQPVRRPYNPDGQGIGEAMASYLADIGLQAELGSVGDWSAYLDARSKGELLGLYQLGWTGDNGDPDNFLGYFYANNPVPQEGYYENADVTKLLEQARSIVDYPSRLAIYDKVEQIQHDEVARLYIAHGPVELAFAKRVSGYVPNPTGTEHFKFVSMQ